MPQFRKVSGGTGDLCLFIAAAPTVSTCIFTLDLPARNSLIIEKRALPILPRSLFTGEVIIGVKERLSYTIKSKKLGFPSAESQLPLPPARDAREVHFEILFIRLLCALEDC